MRSWRGWCLGLAFVCVAPAGALAIEGVWSRSSGWEVSWDDNDHGCTAMNVSDAQDPVQEFVHLTISKKGSRLVFFSPEWTFIRTGESYEVGLLFDGKRYWGGETPGLAAGGLFGFGISASNDLLEDFAKKRKMRVFVDGKKKPLASYSLTGSFRALAETTDCAEARERGWLRNLSADADGATLRYGPGDNPRSSRHQLMRSLGNQLS